VPAQIFSLVKFIRLGRQMLEAETHRLLASDLDHPIFHGVALQACCTSQFFGSSSCKDILYDFFVMTRHLLMTAIVTTIVAVALH